MIRQEKTITIFGRPFKVTYSPFTKERSSNMGQCSNMDQWIWLNSEMPDDSIESTLLHEVLHAISDSLGLGLTEVQVQGVESGLYGLGVKIKTEDVNGKD